MPLAIMTGPLSMNFFVRLLRTSLLCALVTCAAARAADTPRQIISQAALTDDAAKKRELIAQLMGQADPAIAPLLEAWRTDALFLYTPSDGVKVPVQLTGEKDEAGTQTATRIDTGTPVADA